MEINYEESKCVRCCVCATECEYGGIKIQRGRIIINEDRNEDWANIVAICPTGAITIKNTDVNKEGAQGRAPAAH